MTDYFDIKKVALLLGCTERHIRSMCIEGRLAGAVKSGNRWKVPPAADPKLLAAVTEGTMVDSDELSGVPANKRNEALQRLGIIQDFEKFAAVFVKKEGIFSDAYDVYVSQHQRLSKRSLQRWIFRYRQQGLIGLVDTRGGGEFVSQMMSPEAFELFKSMYLTQQRLSVKTCWQNISFINKDQQNGWKIPSLPFMYKYIKSRIPLFVEILHREGIAAYQAKCAPYIQTDPDSVAPGSVWVGDHGQFNCWIRHRGRWIRPWLTAWEDRRSRTIVGWYISASPNQTTILSAMKRALEKHGPPDMAKIDNGKDYDSEMFTGTTKARRRALKKGYVDEQMVAGIYAMMDIGVSFSIKYHPQSKIIERFFDTIDCQLTKTVPTYCGKDTGRKPDDLNNMLTSEKVISEAHDLESFSEITGKYIAAYNNTAHTGAGMDGRSPAEVLATRTSRRVLADGVLDLLLRVWSGELTVGKNGVLFKKMWYGQYDTELLVRQGKKVRVAYDPDDLRSLYIYDAVTFTLITIAEQNQLILYGSAVDEESLREAMRQKSRAIRLAKDYRDSRLTANMDLTSLAIRAMAEGAKEKPAAQRAGTIRPVRTPLDSQVREHKRREIIEAIRPKTAKKAAGGEDIKVLNFDFSQLKPVEKYKDLNLFDE